MALAAVSYYRRAHILTKRPVPPAADVLAEHSVSALYRGTLSRRKADGEEFDCPTVTFLVTDDVAGLRIVLIAVHAN
jgi:hypothetical protein